MGRKRIFALFCVLLMLLACNFITGTNEDEVEQTETDAEIDSLGPRPTIASSGRVLSTSEFCPGNELVLVTGREVRQTPDLGEPSTRKPFDDPTFGTCLVRVTDRTTDLSPEDISPGLKNEYSRVQAFNADGSFFLIRGVDATWYVYDSGTLKPVAKLPFDGAVDPRWSADEPMKLYYNEDTRLVYYNLQTGQSHLLHDFAADFPDYKLASVTMRYEGSPSLDGRYWGMMALNEQWENVALLVYDQHLDQVVATRELNAIPELDSVTISPLANYFLAFFDYCEEGLGDTRRPCGLMVYDRELREVRGLLRVVGHSDVALDADGREVLIYQDIDTDHISMLELESGTITALLPIDFSHSAIGFHFSGRAVYQPGWALVSTYNGGYPDDATWMDDQVFAIELKPQGQVVRLAHTHSLVDEDQEHDYWAEPQATVNQDFSRILFTTNWGRSGTGEVETIMILLPDDWLKGLP